MAIKMRRGNYQDFNPNKLLPGEWAVSLDKKYVHMCFSPGVVSRMATYDAFEEDMKEIQLIIATCKDIQTAVERFSNMAEQHKNKAETYSIESKSWAAGGTGSRTGEDTNNSKYFSSVSKKEADRAKQEADRASSIVGIGIATNTKAGIIKGNADEFTIGADGKLSMTSSFTAQSTLTAITGTENKKTLFGKIAKSVSSLISHMADKTIHFKTTNNLLATVAGTALDAMQGKALDDKITDVNRKLTLTDVYHDFFSPGQFYGKYTKRGGIVIVHLYCTFASTGVGYADAGLNLPQGYRPAVFHYDTYFDDVALTTRPLRLTLDGKIGLYVPDSGTYRALTTLIFTAS